MESIADLYEALGVEMPTEQETESENNQDTAAPEETGENEREPAEPAGNEEDEATEEAPEETENPEDEPEEPEQTKEERAEQARLRRQRKIDEAVQKAVEEERKRNDERLKAFFSQAKLKNAYKDNAQISTLEEAESWAEADKLAKANAALKKGQLTPEDMQTLIETSPTFRAMQQKQSQQEQQIRDREQQQFQASVAEELAEIRKMNPKIQSLGDILSMETGKQWAKYVQQNGMSYLEAYRLANYEQLMRQGQQVAQTAASTKSQGKSHLKPDTARGQGAVEVPKKIKAYYREFMPNMTDAEIEADYRKRAQEQS